MLVASRRVGRPCPDILNLKFVFHAPFVQDLRLRRPRCSGRRSTWGRSVPCCDWPMTVSDGRSILRFGKLRGNPGMSSVTRTPHLSHCGACPRRVSSPSELISSALVPGPVRPYLAVPGRSSAACGGCTPGRSSICYAYLIHECSAFRSAAQ